MALLKYSVLRLGIFLLVFFGCLYLNLGAFTPFFALIVGLLISWAVGYLFFNSWRLAAIEQLGSRATRRRGRAEKSDNDAEDAIDERNRAAAAADTQARQRWAGSVSADNATAQTEREDDVR